MSSKLEGKENHSYESGMEKEKSDLFNSVKHALHKVREDVVLIGQKVKKNEKEDWGYEKKKLRKIEARKYHDDWTVEYIKLSGKKSVLRVKRIPEKTSCALYDNNEKLSNDYDTIFPVYNENNEWSRVFIASKHGKGKCLLNEAGQEISEYYESISDIVYTPVGGDLSSLKKGKPVSLTGWNISFVGEKRDGSKVLVKNGQEKLLN